MNEPTHGQRRLGLLTGSRAHIIMHPSKRKWETLRNTLWKESAQGFDNQVESGARAWGHQQETPGAGKFWQRHPELELFPGGFHLYRSNDELDGWLGNSPDRELRTITGKLVGGLEVKSPVEDATFWKHINNWKAKHYDQVQHGMLCTGWPLWYLFIHLGEDYQEFKITPNRKWQVEYITRAKDFLSFCYADAAIAKKRPAVKQFI